MREDDRTAMAVALKKIGIPESRAWGLMDMLESMQKLGMNINFSDGVAWNLKCALFELAEFREGLPVQPGDRVRIAPDQLEAEVQRWSNNRDAIRVTLAEMGTVHSVEHSSRGGWIASVEFDEEYWWNGKAHVRYRDSDRKHTYSISLTALEVLTPEDEAAIAAAAPEPETPDEPGIGSGIGWYDGDRYRTAIRTPGNGGSWQLLGLSGLFTWEYVLGLVGKATFTEYQV